LAARLDGFAVFASFHWTMLRAKPIKRNYAFFHSKPNLYGILPALLCLAAAIILIICFLNLSPHPHAQLNPTAYKFIKNVPSVQKIIANEHKANKLPLSQGKVSQHKFSILNNGLLCLSSMVGISPSEQLSYCIPSSNSTQLWKCLNNEEWIPLSAVNDDYCDCSDGSDERSSSACSALIQSAIMFYCAKQFPENTAEVSASPASRNRGRTPPGANRNIVPLSFINDGICDCCDGSDEANNSNIRCPQRC
jgi:hypothetical protein